MSRVFSISLLCFLSLLSGCGKSLNNTNNTHSDVKEITHQQDQAIKLNQLGFLPNDNKVAVIPDVISNEFFILSTQTQQVVYQGQLSAVKRWHLADDQNVRIADFSDFKQQGDFFIQVAGLDDSMSFKIDHQVFHPLHDGALKSYYFNRLGIDIVEPYAHSWPRTIGHDDESVLIHPSAATSGRPALSTLSSPKGWYDAGDYGKYVVNSGITTYTLLAAYEHFEPFYQHHQLTIPESNDEVPDILNEVVWNLDWLASMQDVDGGVYHKLTSLEWAGIIMPIEDTLPRYIIGKSTAATLNFAAVLAQASRVIKPYENNFPGKSQLWLQQAKKAWQWALNNPHVYYQQPEEVKTGIYGDQGVKDEFAWAAAELFITTEDKHFWQYVSNYLNISEQQNISAPSISVPWWKNVAYLAVSSLAFKAQDLLMPKQYQAILSTQEALAVRLLNDYLQHPYKISMQAKDFVWGSNSVVLNKALILLQANKLTGKTAYRQAAIANLDYILGRNATNYSFVTGFGEKTPMFPHHRISASDGVAEPIPGMVVGGPQPKREDGCQYPSHAPAKSYLDHWCSFSTNEVAINWNAPLVYLLAGLLSE